MRKSKMIKKENTTTEKIDLNKMAIFCGAGISYNSGLPLANDLMRYILRVIGFSITDADKILNSKLPFESFIQTLSNECEIEEILNIYKEGLPNTNHFFLANLIKHRLVNTILTTNFDTLIEAALEENKLISGIDFKVYSTVDDFKLIDWESDIPKIIKIHGCVTDTKKMAITLDVVATSQNYNLKRQVIEAFFSKKINPNVLVLGYSCSDLFDITPQIETIFKDNSKIYFIEHELINENKRFEDVAEKEKKDEKWIF